MKCVFLNADIALCFPEMILDDHSEPFLKLVKIRILSHRQHEIRVLPTFLSPSTVNSRYSMIVKGEAYYTVQSAGVVQEHTTRKTTSEEIILVELSALSEKWRSLKVWSIL